MEFSSSVTTLALEIISSRYIIVIGFVVMVWDSILTLPDEIERVWQRGISLPQIAYLTNHYATIAILAVLLRGWSGIGGGLSHQFCENATQIGLAGGIISLGAGNYLVLLQVWQLWEQRPGVKLALTIGWAVTYLVTLIIACVIIAELPPLVFPVPGFNICGLTAVPKLVRVIWLSPVVFEVLIFVFTVWNAFDRPRRNSDSLTRALIRDGLLYFLSLSLLRVFNFVLTDLAPIALVPVGSCLIWELNIVSTNRLILNQRVPLPVLDPAHIDIEFDFTDVRNDIEDPLFSHRRKTSQGQTATTCESFCEPAPTYFGY